MCLVAACAANAPTQRTSEQGAADLAGKTFGVPGEVIEYQVALRGMTVARVVVSVGQPGWTDGKRAIVMRAGGATAGLIDMIGQVRWELTTMLDLDTGAALRALEETSITVGGKTEHDRETRAKRTNVHVAVGMLRAWRSQPGQPAVMNIDIADGYVDVVLWDAGRELHEGRPSIRYDGLAVDRKYRFSMWIADDTSRVPLALSTASKWGRITLDLVSYD